MVEIEVRWWEPHFPFYVAIKSNVSLSSWTSDIEKYNAWLKEHYPDLDIDASISRMDSVVKPYYSYDVGMAYDNWSYCVVVYFKDAKIASHFKLVWYNQ